MSQVCSRGEELGRVEVDDVALLALFGAFGVGRPGHQVAHPHVSVTYRVESGAKGICRTAELDQQLQEITS